MSSDLELIKKSLGGQDDFGNRLLKYSLIRFRRFLVAADFADELQGCGLELFFGWFPVRPAEFLNIPAHP